MSSNFDLEEIHRVHGLMLRAELVVLVVRDRGLRVLMTRCERPPYAGALVLPGGYLREETCLDTTVDIMRIKLGLTRLSFKLAGMYTSPGRDPRTRLASAAYMAIVSHDRIDSWLAENPDFYLPAIASHPEKRFILRYDDEIVTPGFDHAEMIADSVHFTRQMLENSLIAFDALDSSFTLWDLQKTHEILSGAEIEKVRFRKRMLARIFSDGSRLFPTGRYRQAQGRPAQLYERRKSGV